MRDTLSTQCTIHRLDVLHIHSTYTGSFSGIDDIPDAHRLNLVTHLYAAHTFDAFCRITNQWIRSIPWMFLYLDFIWNFDNIQLSGKLL